MTGGNLAGDLPKVKMDLWGSLAAGVRRTVASSRSQDQALVDPRTGVPTSGTRRRSAHVLTGLTLFNRVGKNLTARTAAMPGAFPSGTPATA